MTMNKLIISTLLLAPLGVWAQDETVNDSVIDRTVTVEREFQPTVKAAGKLDTKPQVFQPELEDAIFIYSDYSSPLNIDKNVNTLGYATTVFNRPRVHHGYLRGGIGHPNTLLDFSYRVDDETLGIRDSRGKAKKEGYLDLHANHFGQWGRKMLEKTSIGLDYTYNFPAAQLYFSAAGGNEFFTHYYRYIDHATNTFNTAWKDFDKNINQAFWNADAKIGVQNIPGAEVLYRAQTGYEGFYIPDGHGAIPSSLQEHKVHTTAMFEWSKDVHHIGIDADVQNRFYTGATTITSKHGIHVEPYYCYEGDRIRVHAGVNLDLGLGGYRGRLNKSDVNAFGVSPNVHFEADITKTWLTFFANATGGLAAEGFREELGEHRFLDVQNLISVMQNGCCAAYKPIDAVAGFRFKPLPTLLFEVHAGYSMTLDEHILGYYLWNRFQHIEQDQQTVKVGGTLHYHYQDIFTMELGGDYFFGPSRELKAREDVTTELLDLEQGAWSWNAAPYGKCKWQIHARFDGRINKHWSLYSDNYLVGSRTMLTLDILYYVRETLPSGEVAIKPGMRLAPSDDIVLKPYFDLNLGAEYTYNDRLSFFGQLNNYLAWTAALTPMLLPYTPAQGVNCLFGVSWKF